MSARNVKVNHPTYVSIFVPLPQALDVLVLPINRNVQWGKPGRCKHQRKQQPANPSVTITKWMNALERCMGPTSYLQNFSRLVDSDLNEMVNLLKKPR